MERYPKNMLRDDGTLDMSQFLPEGGNVFREDGKRFYWNLAPIGVTIWEAYGITDSKGRKPEAVRERGVPEGIDGNGKSHRERKIVLIKWEVT